MNFLSLLSFAAFLGFVEIVHLSAQIVENYNFEQQNSANEKIPSEWIIPKDSTWHWTNVDGYSGNTSLRCNTKVHSATAPVVQHIMLQANSTYILSCAIKSDRILKPVVRLKHSGAPGKELVRIQGDYKAGVWHLYMHEFRTGAGGEFLIELWADILHLQKGTGTHSGTIAVDDVQVLSPEQAKELSALRSTIKSENLALNKRYTLDPAPGYHHTKDPDDLAYLTDGQYTTGYFWTQKTTVGWVRVPHVTITIDLENHHSIGGIALNTAGGIAGVKTPSSIAVLVSVDGRLFHQAGDLIQLSDNENPTPEYGKYFVHRLYTDKLKIHGRYIKLIIELTGTTFFADEVEVYRGEDAWKNLPLPGEPVVFPREHFDQDIFNVNLRRRLEKDLEVVRCELAQQVYVEDVVDRATERIKFLEREIAQLPKVDARNFQGIFPINEVHARIYAALGKLRQASGRSAIVAWSANPWDYLAPTQLPDRPSPAKISVALMKNEKRAAALNLTNCTEQSLTAHLSFTNLPDGSLPSYIQVHEVGWTDTKEGTAVAAALFPAPRTERGYEIALPAGMTRQVWLTLDAKILPASNYQGFVVAKANHQNILQIPMTIRVFDLEFPQKPHLSVGGWDYTNTNLNAITPQNREKIIAYLKTCFVNSPWATKGVVPFGQFDASGQFQTEPSTKNFDAWIERWPKVQRYQIFLNVGDTIAGTKIGEQLFERKIRIWINFWVKYAASRNINPDQLFFLLLDEPSSVEKDNIIISWSHAIKAAQPQVNIWDDGTRPPERCTPEVMQAVDILCPHRPTLLKGETDLNFYFQHRATGGRLDLYSCLGRSRLLDPYSYYRLQAWSCFQIGAEGSFFWCFSGNNGINPWNEYAPQNTEYAPYFIGPDSVTPGKQMEAIRESVADYEYLVMLRDAIANLQKNHPDHALLPTAKKLLDTATERVLSSPGATDLDWIEIKDRSIADIVRIEIGAMLEKLQKN